MPERGIVWHKPKAVLTDEERELIEKAVESGMVKHIPMGKRGEPKLKSIPGWMNRKRKTK